MIPTFAIERTQELLYEFDAILEENKIPKVPIFLDSPMAIKATDVFRHSSQYFNDTDKAEAKIDDHFHFPELKLTQSVFQSKEINKVTGPKVIIAGAGMMNGGRILHHAKRYLSDPKSMLLIIGYQVVGSMGRRLFDGEKLVKIHGENINVKANIKAIGAYSAHADQPKLIEFIRAINPKPKKIFITHGEPEQATALAEKIKQEFGIETFIPKFGESVELL